MGLALEDVFAGLGAGLSGAADQYVAGQTRQLKEKEIDNRREVSLLQQEIRLMLESMKEGGRNERYDKASGNVVAQQAGQTARNDTDNATTLDVAGIRDETTRRGQDITQTLGIARDDTTRRGQDFGFTLGGRRDDTTRRGQDIGATTTRRGQDFAFSLGTTAETGRNTRATDVNALRQQEITQRAEIEKGKNRDPWGAVTFGGTPAEVREGTTTRPTAQPIEVKETPAPGLPVTPPKSPEGVADQLSRLSDQVKSLMTQVQQAKTPAQRQAFKQQLARALEAYQKAGGK